MRRVVPILAVASVLFITGSSHAGLVVTVSTGHTGANTKINADSTSAWNFQLLAGAPSITEVKGVFDMKIDGNAPTSNITFTLYDRFNGYQDPSAVVLGSVTLTPASFTQSFAPVTFDIQSLNLASSPINPTNFSLALTSSTPHNKTYHIKSDDFSAGPSDYINIGPPVPISAVPEPSTFAMALGALVPVGLAVARRRRCEV